LLAFCSVLLGKSLEGGLIAVGGLNLGGGLDPVYNAVGIAEAAVEKGAATLLVPISARKQLNDLSDEMAMRLSIVYYADAREALLKALADKSASHCARDCNITARNTHACRCRRRSCDT
jgi:ATP-dependent Lon protease